MLLLDVGKDVGVEFKGKVLVDFFVNLIENGGGW